VFWEKIAEIHEKPFKRWLIQARFREFTPEFCYIEEYNLRQCVRIVYIIYAECCLTI